MTGVYDEMSDRSYPYYKGGSELQRKMRDLLREKMEAMVLKCMIMNGGILITRIGNRTALPIFHFQK